jgi:beta-galactosidase
LKILSLQTKAEVGIAFSFPSQIAVHLSLNNTMARFRHAGIYFTGETWIRAIVDISRSDLKYKLLLVPGVTVMDKTTANKIRAFVQNGGTVVMTSNSAFVDTNGQVFASTRPGMLNDVFGIRLGGYEETEAMNEISPKAYTGKKLGLTYAGKAIDTESVRFDIIEPKTAQVLGNLTSLDKDYPIVTLNKFGKGKAIYVGLPAKGEVLGKIVDDLIPQLGITKGPDVPEGVMARQIDDKHFLYLNVCSVRKQVQLSGKSRSILFNKDYSGGFTIEPYEPEFIEVK